MQAIKSSLDGAFHFWEESDPSLVKIQELIKTVAKVRTKRRSTNDL